MLYRSRSGEYKDYWRETRAQYADGTSLTGAMRTLFGWIGDLIGTTLGAVMGTLIGLGLFIPDSLLRGAAWIYDQIKERANMFVSIAGKYPLFASFNNHTQPNNYTQKAWNISTVTLGIVIAIVPYIAIKCVSI